VPRGRTGLAYDPEAADALEGSDGKEPGDMADDDGTTKS
jgi:hypothetical protein